VNVFASVPVCTATGKKAYGSPELAARAARRVRRYTDDRLHPYRCPECRCWHLGHSDSHKKIT
jgi:hypothetical protein